MTSFSYLARSELTFQEEEEHGGVEAGGDDHQEKQGGPAQRPDGGDVHPGPVLPGLFPPAICDERGSVVSQSCVVVVGVVGRHAWVKRNILFPESQRTSSKA